MREHLQRFAVPFEYPVCFTEDLFAPANAALVDAMSFRGRKQHRALFVLDAGLVQARPSLLEDIRGFSQAHRGTIELAAEPVIVAGGEASKNAPELPLYLQALAHEHRLDRHAFFVAVGGGAVLDVVGFAAATAHRGVRLIRVPTTVLAQADSGVGVKNGINAFGKKNFVGTFSPPWAVIIDPSFLDTLTPRDRRSGFAEAVKVALIRDASFFGWISANAGALVRGERGALSHLVQTSAKLHLRHIAEGGDPFEAGSARPLDFGHWAAHKLETLTAHRLRHGEAVAIGMALDTLYACGAELIATEDAALVLEVLERLGFVLWDEALEQTLPDGRLAILEGLSEFREHLGGELTVTLLAEIGRGVEVHDINPSLVTRAVERLRAGAGGASRGAA
jgi:3-dehydroquinate synthase